MSKKYLDGIKSPEDVKKIPENELDDLAREIREELIETVSKTGGHLASNLGVVELSIALHRVFSTPHDSIIWDVGHQCYVHKLLTGRADRFSTLRQKDGISGFTRRSESEHDKMSGGHSSVALSAAYGVDAANTILGKDSYTVAVIGDGAFTGGMVYEALNNAGRAGKGSHLIVVLNDNEMSISPNVGSFARYLGQIKANPRYVRMKANTEKVISSVPLIGRAAVSILYDAKKSVKDKLYGSNMFEDLGFRYIGPVDGHDIHHLCEALEAAKEANYPIILHINTVKGKGFRPAELAPSKFHGVSAFNLDTGDPLYSETSFSEKFGEFLLEAAQKDNHICCVTAAMSLGTGVDAFRERFPERFFDVGIAEQHATTFAAGLSAGGMFPVFAVYSSFLQRAYDQVIHDCALQKLKIVFAVDRAGFVGSDGESHHGIFDAAFLNTIPDIIVLAPTSFLELSNALNKAFYETPGPVAVRYPRGIEPELPEDFDESFPDWLIYGERESGVTIITYGRIFAQACRAKKALDVQGIRTKIIKLNTVKPISNSAVKAALDCENVFFFEEGQRFGGIGETFGDKLFKFGYKGNYTNIAVEGEFPPQDSVKGLLARYGLDCDGMINTVLKGLDKNNG